MSECQADVSDAAGSTVITLTGDIDGRAADVLTGAYERAAARGDPQAVVLDFGGVGYINSTGIALIVNVLARARAEGRKLMAAGLSEHYREIFDITRLSDFIEVFATLGDAVRHATTAGGSGAVE
jgi:anti-sigma B factor antagonist